MYKDELLEKRLIELSAQSYYRNIIICSDFLDLKELNILHSIPHTELYTRYKTCGGYESSERQMVAFIPDALCCTEKDFKMLSLKISPLNAKYSEELTHRDFLGAILNLGIDRSKTGDIITARNEAVFFLHSSLADFLIKNLMRVKHTAVIAAPISPSDIENFNPQFEEIRGTLTSVRLDSLLALTFPLSRSKMTAVIEGARVFVNGRLITSNGYQPKENDIISVRKMGKIRYIGILNKTKKKSFFGSCTQIYIKRQTPKSRQKIHT